MDKFVLNKVINEQNKEILLIAQEECAEVTQAISKVFRFGIEGEEEVGDLLCMIDLMIENQILDANVVHRATVNKRHKLAKWSNIK